MDSTGQSRRTVFSAGAAQSSRKLTTASLAIAAASGIGMSIAASQPPKQPPKPRPLAANDVSILFPGAKDREGFGQSDRDVELERARGHRSRLVGCGLSPARWRSPKIRRRRSPRPTSRCNCRPRSSRSTPGSWPASASMPGAPGLSKEIIEQLGRQPQIRLIIQPVTNGPGGTIQVHDIAAHLIFNFTPEPDPGRPGCEPCSGRNRTMSVQAIVRDTAALRDQLASGKVRRRQGRYSRATQRASRSIGASAMPFREALKGHV